MVAEEVSLLANRAVDTFGQIANESNIP